MRVLSSDDIAAVLTPRLVVDALEAAFRAPVEVPVRHHHRMAKVGEPDAMLLLMPAWHAPGAPAPTYAGVKVVSVVPGNARRGKQSVVGAYLLLSGETGETLAVIDGSALTLWRTAAASALAARRLARPDASRLVMVGAGSLAPYLIAAHASERPIDTVTIWNRDAAKAEAVAARLSAGEGLSAGRSTTITATADLEAAVAAADIVSCATLSTEPIVLGRWLRPGTHVDLVGGFTPQMREADDEAVRRAEVYVDTRAGATVEAGDIVQPLASGALTHAGIRGDLFDLCRGTAPGRTDPAAITLFKSAGTALEDLAAAALVYERSG